MISKVVPLWELYLDVTPLWTELKNFMSLAFVIAFPYSPLLFQEVACIKMLTLHIDFQGISTNVAYLSKRSSF